MKIKFIAGPMSRSNSVPSDGKFADFGGLVRTCVRFQRAKGGVHRCASYAPRSQVGKHPQCFPGIKGGGRSPGLVRVSPPVCPTKYSTKERGLVMVRKYKKRKTRSRRR